MQRLPSKKTKEPAGLRQEECCGVCVCVVYLLVYVTGY